jgi:hypothetical protein
MPEIAAASVRLAVGEFQGSRLVAGCGEKHVGVTALLRRRRISCWPSTSKKAMLSASELTRIIVCRYLVMACPQVRVGAFVAARWTGRVVMTRMVTLAVEVIEIG